MRRDASTARLACFAGSLIATFGCASNEASKGRAGEASKDAGDHLCAVVARGVERVDAHTLRGPRSYVDGYAPANADGTVNVVVEIPTGCDDKWEVAKPTGTLERDWEAGRPRTLGYLGYPGNYGMIPRTLLSREEGGDGDPVDVIVLGPPRSRGSVIKAKIVGVLFLTDRGERDDKLIAVPTDGPLADVSNIATLQQRFPGVDTIVRRWFESYKGPELVRSRGFGGPAEARRVLEGGVAAYGR